MKKHNQKDIQMNCNSQLQSGAALPASDGSAKTCEFIVAWKECGEPATHYRQIISLSVIKGQKHEFRPPREHYCAKHYPLAEKWCNPDRTQFRYEMGELSLNDKISNAAGRKETNARPV